MKKNILALLIFLFPSVAAHALNVQNHRYYFHGGRTDTLVESTPRPMDSLTLGLGTGFALHPFEFGSSVGGVVPQSVVDFILSFDFGASYSFSDKIALGLNVPMHATENIRSLGDTSKETVLSLGDMTLSWLFNIIDRDDNGLGAGLALMPFLNFPTGVNGNFIGDTNLDGGLIFAADVERDAHYAGLNLGLRFRQEENFLNLRVAQELLYAFAYHHPIIDAQDFDGFIEVSGSTVLNDFLQRGNSSPVEAKLGLSKVFFPEKPVTIKLVNGIGLGNGYGNPDYRAVVSVSYSHYLPRTKIVEKTVMIERVQKVEQALKELTIYYPTDGTHVDPFYDQKIAGIASVIKSNPDMGPLYIVGHTDDVGSDAYNEALSERRARQASASILGNGLLAKDVIWFGVGESEHVVPNNNDSNRALNRRTVFTFQKPAQLIEKSGGPPVVDEVPPRGSDSYTETLKQQENQRFVDDDETQPLPVDEEVREAVTPEVKPRKTWKSARKERRQKRSHDALQERSLREEEGVGDEEENFEEPFVE